MGLVGAALTAFYMARLTTLTFDGTERFDHHHLHPHESPATMTVPLVVLAVLSVIGGFVGVPHSLGGSNAIEQWLEPVFARAHSKLLHAPHGEGAVEYVLMVLSVGVGITGIWLARRWYLSKPEIPKMLATRFGPLYNLLRDKYKVDELYDAVIVTPIHKTSEAFLWKIFDVKIVDGVVNGVPKLIALFSSLARKVQTGIAQSYVFVFVLGVVVILGILIMK